MNLEWERENENSRLRQCEGDNAMKNFKGSVCLAVQAVNGHLSYVEWQGRLLHCYRSQPEMSWLYSQGGNWPNLAAHFTYEGAWVKNTFTVLIN